MADQAALNIDPNPATPEPAAPAAAPAAEPQAPATPWAESLDRSFADVPAEMRTRLDQYLRSEVQPYVTRREQELGQVGEIWDNLWDENQTIGTYLSLAESIYGPELAQKVAATFSEHFEAQGMAPAAAAQAGAQAAAQQAAQEPGAAPAENQVPSFEEWLTQQPPEVQKIVMDQVSNNENDVYEGQLEQLSKMEKTIKGNEERFSRYVVAAEGDLGEALELWRVEMAPLISEHPDVFGWSDPEAAAAPVAPAAPANVAPAVLGTSSAPGGTEPVQTVPDHQTWDEAIHDFFVQDLNHTGATSVGRI